MDNWLLCDFHIHTNISDGSLKVSEVVDLYGQYGFDVIAITDHAFDSVFLKKLRERGNKVSCVSRENFREYMDILKREQERAWKEYKMILIPGYEITNNTDYYHIVALDVQEYIDPSFEVIKILRMIKECGGISIAAHPLKKNSDNKYLSRHLYENINIYKDMFDAWEIANQFDLYNEIIEKRCRFVGNSDFHHIKHFYSWKTLIKAEKDPEAIKYAIRRNDNIAITFLKPHTNKKEIKILDEASEHAK